MRERIAFAHSHSLIKAEFPHFSLQRHCNAKTRKRVWKNIHMGSALKMRALFFQDDKNNIEIVFL